MRNFAPITELASFQEIDLHKLQDEGIRAVFIDVDNTLFIPNTALGVQELAAVRAFFEQLRAMDLQVVAISNNLTKEHRAFFAQIGVHIIQFARKPLSIGFKKAYAALKDDTINKNEIVHIGDQFLTDGIGATLYGIRYYLVTPIEQKNDLITAIPSRLLERWLGLRKKE